MTITVLLFASAREAARTGECPLALPEGASGETARAALAGMFPALGPVLAHARLAVNEEYRPWETALAERDVLAVIPPVSGG